MYRKQIDFPITIEYKATSNDNNNEFELQLGRKNELYQLIMEYHIQNKDTNIEDYYYYLNWKSYNLKLRLNCFISTKDVVVDKELKYLIKDMKNDKEDIGLIIINKNEDKPIENNNEGNVINLVLLKDETKLIYKNKGIIINNIVNKLWFNNSIITIQYFNNNYYYLIQLNNNNIPTYFKINENCDIKVIENKNKLEIAFDDIKMNKQLDEMMDIITWYFTTIDKTKQSNINGNCLLEIQTESIYTKYQKYIKHYLNSTIKNDISLISINLLKLIQKNKGEQNELDINEISEKLSKIINSSNNIQQQKIIIIKGINELLYYNLIDKKDCLTIIDKLLQFDNNKTLFFLFLINSKLKTKIQFNFQFTYTLIDINNTPSLKPTFNNNSDSYYQLLTHKIDLKELGGLFQIKEKLNFYIKLYQHPQTIIRLSPFNKYLITGPANSGKSLLAKGFADMFQLPIVFVNCANLFSNQFSETESNLKELFHFKDKLNSKYVIILENIELISIKRGSSEDQFSDLQNRILTCLLNELDGLNENFDFVLIATTNYLNRIDNALLRPGRIDQIIEITPPNSKERLNIYYSLLKYFYKINYIPLTIEEEEIFIKLTDGLLPNQIHYYLNSSIKHCLNNDIFLIEFNIILPFFK